MRIGIDLGGTKIECAVLGDRGQEFFRRRVPTPRDDYEATLDAIAGLVAEAERDLQRQGLWPSGPEAGAPSILPVGIGTPGAISPATGLLKNANSIWLNGRSLAQDLEARLARPLRLANDANCFALSEAVDGAGQGAEVVFGVILGTGVGAGIVVRGELLTGPNAIAGEWGHNPLPLPREEDLPLRACYCGRKGCVETYVSGPALQRDGDMDRYEERLARSLAGVINILDPDVIVLGGGVSNVERLYENVPRLWTPYVFSDRIATRIAKHAHGDSSGVRGAAWLWGR
jgi:fructokinase